MKALLLIAIGGGLGAVSRWGLGTWIDGRNATGFPLGVFAANILGCLLFGLLFGLGESRSWMTDQLRLLIFTGFLGSFTTFSTFSWNTLELIKGGQLGSALLNVGASLCLGLICVWAGYSLAAKIS